MILKKAVFYLIVFVAGFTACEDGYFPEGYWPYQVEYMLSNDDVKTWLVQSEVVNGEVQPIEECMDSIRWQFEVITSDSIAAYKLTFDNACLMYDTTVIGGLRASGGEGYFTDTLYYQQANSTEKRMYVEHITSNLLRLNYTEGGDSYEVRLESIPSDYLTRQAAEIIAGSSSTGHLWKLRSLNVDGQNRALTNCVDSTLWKFEPTTGGIRMQSLKATTEDCSEYGMTDWGFVQLKSTSEGYFADGLTLDGSITAEIEFTEFSSDNIRVSYWIQDTIIYRAAYRRVN